MNAQRRKRLAEAAALLQQANDKKTELDELLEQAKSIIEEVASEEREYYDNMPESLQNGERGSRADEVASNLEGIELEFTLDLDDVISTLEDAQA